jgi:glycerol-3-phosphate dehydrogenase
VPGLVVVAGGKWTTYRIMAKDAIDAAAAAPDANVPKSVTQDIALLGAEGYQVAWNKRAKIAKAFACRQGAYRAPAQPPRRDDG